MSLLYWDPFAGISGNMAVGSLLDLGADPERLTNLLESIPFPEGRLELLLERRIKKGFDGTYFNTADDDGPAHDHDPAGEGPHNHHDHEHEDQHDHEHPHPDAPEHTHSGVMATGRKTDLADLKMCQREKFICLKKLGKTDKHNKEKKHDHHHDDEHKHGKKGHHHSTGESHDHAASTSSSGHSHPQGGTCAAKWAAKNSPAPEHAHPHVHGDHGEHVHLHRGMPEIRELLAKADLTPAMLDTALSCFAALAEAEGRVHGKKPEEVHFHEVGARDSIADLVGVAICLHDLGITSVHTGPVHLGSGFITCQHGKLPVPAPATAILLEGYPVFAEPGIVGELTTPTGAAILRGLHAQPGFPTPFTYHRVGFGHGKKDFPLPNTLRAFLGDNVGTRKQLEMVALLETNLDNVTGELLGHVAEKAMAAGALDVALTPIFMKKGRPGTRLSVIGKPQDLEALETLLYQELPTLGIRRQLIQRSVLSREESHRITAAGSLPSKRVQELDGTVSETLEFESRRILASHLGKPVRRLPDQ